MKQSEYEKLCDEAFGKPEKPNLLKALKRHKELAICAAAVLVLAAAVLTVFFLREPDLYVHREIPKPVLMWIDSRSETGFNGKDIKGRQWVVV